jgi:hypothetical protein
METRMLVNNTAMGYSPIKLMNINISQNSRAKLYTLRMLTNALPFARYVGNIATSIRGIGGIISAQMAIAGHNIPHPSMCSQTTRESLIQLTPNARTCLGVFGLFNLGKKSLGS